MCLWHDGEKINLAASGKLVEVNKGSRKYYAQRQSGKEQWPGASKWFHWEVYPTTQGYCRISVKVVSKRILQ